jgi:tetratricopeptide (TPR) repeat protein
LQINDPAGSRGDFDRVLTSPRASQGVRLYCYHRRSWANCLLKDYAAAVDDATQAIELVGHGHRMLPTFLNQRAYIRALANTSKEELEAGLKDVEEAIAMERDDNAAFIDTRGYLLHLLGRHKEALVDIKRAIELTKGSRERAYRFNDAQELKENLAVMHHHRALIHDALGNKDEAIEDFRLAEEFGYNPDAGVL